MFFFSLFKDLFCLYECFACMYVHTHVFQMAVSHHVDAENQS